MKLWLLTLLFLMPSVMAASVTLEYPGNVTYENSTVDVSYTPSGQDQCKIELNGVNMSYPLCSNTTLTYVHFNDANKVLALDFAEGTGTTVYDRSTRETVGTVDATWITDGRYGSGLNFSGTGELNITNVPLDNRDFTLSAWAKRETSGSWDSIIFQGSTSTNNGLQFGFRTTNYFTCAFWGNDLNTPGTYGTTGWNLWTCTYDAATNNRTIYRNGAYVTSDTASADYQYSGSNPVEIGHNNINGWNFNGPIDEVAIWNRTLTADEIRQMYNESRFDGTHNIKVYANDSSAGAWTNSSLTTFSINSTLGVDIISPENQTYENSTINITYNPRYQDQCKIELNGVNMSYPLCSNTTLTYVHFNESNKVLAFDFSEDTGTTVHDRGPNSFTGTSSGSPGWNSSGYRGSSGTFDGNSGYTVSDDPLVQVSNNITVMLWIYSGESQSGNMIPVGKGQEYLLTYSHNTGSFSGAFAISSSSTWYSSNTEEYTLGKDTWHHLTGTYNGSHVSLYVNGTLANSQDHGSLTIDDTSNGIGIGAAGIGTGFTGNIDELIILNRSLNATEIQQIYSESRFDGTHNIKVYANDSSTGAWNSSPAVTFTVQGSECGSVTSDFNLTENSSTSSECLIIGSNNIIIDGKGFSIGGSGTAISNSGGYDNITIRNLQIDTTGTGVSIEDANLVNITNVTSISATVDLFLNNTNATVTDSTFGDYQLRGLIALNNSDAHVEWLNPMEANGSNFTRDIVIQHNNVTVNASGTGLNTSAEITLYNLATNFGNPGITRNRVACSASTCTNLTPFNQATVTFNVTEWSGYGVNETCGTITSDVTIINDVYANGTCYTIGADDVTVNGAGYRIVNDGTASSNGIVNSGGYDGITIGNFSDIRNFENGISFSNSENSTIINNTITNNSADCIVYDGDSSDNVIMQDNSISFCTDGIQLDDLDNLTITGNTIFNNSDAGIDTISSTMENISITYNQIDNNTNEALYVRSVSGNGYRNFSWNNVSTNGANTIDLPNSGTAWNISHNIIERTTADYAIIYGSNSNIYNNTFRHSTNRLWLHNAGTGGTKFYNNTVYNWTGYGVQYQVSGGEMTNNTFNLTARVLQSDAPSLVADNTFVNSNEMFMNGGGSGDNITRNVFRNASGGCLVITFSSTYVTHNTFTDCGGSVVNSAGGSGGNTYAFNNMSEGTNAAILLRYGSSNEVYNNTISNYDTGIRVRTSNQNNNVYRNTILNGSSGIDIWQDGNNFSNNTIRNMANQCIYVLNAHNNFVIGETLDNCSTGIQILGTGDATNNSFRDMNLTNTSTDINIGGAGSSSNNTFINVTYEQVSVGSGHEYTRGWWYQAQVVNQTGGAVTNADVNISNSTESVSNLSTGGNSLASRIALYEFRNNSGTLYYYNNHTINLSAQNHIDTSYTRNITTNFVYDTLTLNKLQATISSPTNTTYSDSNISINYSTYADACRVELNGVNMSYPLCSNTTLTYVHFNDSDKLFALDFSEGTGSTTYDRSTNGESVSVTEPTWNSSGKYGYALTFDGGDDIHPSGDKIINIANQPLTFMAWIHTADNEGVIIERGGGTFGVQLAVNNSNASFTYRRSTGTNFTTISGRQINDNQWHHIIGSVNSTGAMALYVDGVLEGTNTASLIPSDAADGLSIGSPIDQGGTNSAVLVEDYFTGSIDEILYLNRAITEDEATQYYNETAFSGTHTLRVHVNNTEGDYQTDEVNFTIDSTSPVINLSEPLNRTYQNSNINITYSALNYDGCRLELNGVNMSYPLCSNTTLTYVHMNDSSKVFAIDMAEGTGSSVQDRSVSDLSGTFVNSMAWNASGKYGSALQFEGTTAYVSFPDSDNLNIDGSYTTSVWVKAGPSVETWGAIYTKRAGGAVNGFNLQKHSTTDELSVYHGTLDHVNLSIQISDLQDDYHHLAITYNGSHIQAYLDGQLNFTGALIPPTTGAGTFYLGADRNGGAVWQGSIDELAIWNRTLSAKEIEYLYHNAAFPGTHNLTAWANRSSLATSDSITFTIGGSACNPVEGLPWFLDLSSNCTVSGKNITIKDWNLSSTGDGTITIEESNITYSSRNLNAVTGEAKLIKGLNVILTGSS